MKISKTAFKEFTRCPIVYPLDEIYRKKLKSNVSFFNDEDYEKKIEILGSMFDVESGDDLLEESNPQLEAMLKYYSDVEKYAIEIANKIFNIKTCYHQNTLNQKSFTYTDKANNELYCYLDGYYEDSDTIYVFEVKATTSKKFLELGPKRKKEIEGTKYNSIFVQKNNVLNITDEFTEELDVDKFNSYYNKLFDRYNECGKYVFDIAVERYIIENSINTKYPNLKGKKVKYFLCVLNSNYEFDGKYIDNNPVYSTDKYGNELISFVDLTHVTKDYLDKIQKYHNELINLVLENKFDEIVVGKFCEHNKQTKCLFTNTCFEKAKVKGSILEYMGIKKFRNSNGTSVDAFDLINQGKYMMNSIPKSALINANHLLQRNSFESDIEYFDIEKITKGLEEIKYPIYHLDFESFPGPLPRYKYENPYNQSLFQFSIHIEKSKMECDIDKDHYSFLAKDFSDCREDLIEELIRVIDLSKGGTVLVYNKSFEHSRIKELSHIFPKYKTQLDKINKHMFDLLDIVRTNNRFYKGLGFDEERSKLVNYYHNKLQGSYSIKKVLPVFSSLSYSQLSVKNGTEAISAYASFPYLDEHDLLEVRNNLIEYCKQDTWSMVVILWGLINKVSEYQK